MAKIAINEMTTYRWSFEDDIASYAALEVEGVGVWRQKLSDFGEDKGIELLRDRGLAVSSLSWAGGFTGSDGRSYSESLEDARDSLRLAAELRADCLIVYTGGRGGHTHNHARRLFRGALKELLPLASEFDVPLAIEPMHAGCAADWTFLTSLSDILCLLDDLQSEHVKMVLDVYHLGHDDKVLDRLSQFAPRIALVQMGDAKAPPVEEQNRCPLGEGVLPLREIVAALDAGGYEGFYEIELVGQEIEASDYRDVLVRSKRALLEMLPVSR
jgi:sugar phosphate isomerase/epimerase